MTYQPSYLTIVDNPPVCVRDMPTAETPLARLRRLGPQSLSTTEIVNLILQQGSLEESTQLVSDYKTLRALSAATIEQLAGLPGIGPATAARLVAACELGRRVMVESAPDPWQIRAPSDAAHILTPQLAHLDREHFVVLTLDTRNRVIRQRTLYTGSLNTSLVRPAECFRQAIEDNAAGVIVAHNHPSGDPNPSPEDVALTRRLVDAGKLLEIAVLDHVIVGANRFVSLRERNLGFEAA